MANVKFANAAGKYQDDDARHDLVDYITQRKKTPNHIVSFSHGDISQAADQMTQTARSFGKDQGVRSYHFIISFAPGDINCMVFLFLPRSTTNLKAKSRKIMRNHLQTYEHFIRDPRDALRIPLRQ